MDEQLLTLQKFPRHNRSFLKNSIKPKKHFLNSVNQELLNKEITFKMENIPEFICDLDNIEDQKACSVVFHALDKLQPDVTPKPIIGFNPQDNYYNLIGAEYNEKITLKQMQDIESYNSQLIGAPITDIHVDSHGDKLLLVVRVTKRSSLNVSISNHPNDITQQPTPCKTVDINFLPPVITTKKRKLEE